MLEIESHMPQLVGEVVIRENGGLQTIAAYYEGHQRLDWFPFMNGRHVMGWTGPETRITFKRLMPTSTFIVREGESAAQSLKPEENLSLTEA